MLHAEEYTRQIHRQHPMPFFEGHLVKAKARARNAGIIHRSVESTEPFDSGRNHSLDLRLVRNIDVQRDRFPARGLDARDRLLGASIVHVGDDDLRARSGVDLGNAFADACPTPGDDGNLALDEGEAPINLNT